MGPRRSRGADRADLERTLALVAREYPAEAREYATSDVKRTAFHIELVRRWKGTGITICDVGGSISLFSVGCAVLGMRAIVVDKFVTRWPVRERIFSTVHQRHGVEIIQCDVVAEPLSLPAASLDVAASFDSIEHWHGSPKPVLHALKAALKPHGMLLISAPNCVNLRKRITVPFGYGKWCSIQDWYEASEFLSHVHEPDVDDLRYIARDLGLKEVEILGRNWLGHAHRKKMMRIGTRMIDHLLRLRPSLCSDLYLIGQI